MSSHPVTKVGQPKTGLGPSVMLFQESPGVDPVPPSQAKACIRTRLASVSAPSTAMQLPSPRANTIQCSGFA